ncbi:hypothetical protein LTR37_012277 [Vermiconidia calcicola]|uniref:Uncharacterized protein n=1 Tax=Vermiconidia calcicola TaxID=1690605 RepID=A0ACC3MZY0_9PEZI|nr:hypothetical protein LTR37_012277 [Vermiconidia calcicola]
MRNMLLLILPLFATAAAAVPQTDVINGNLSLQHPELFSLHWQMLEQNSTSGFETPMVDFLSQYLESKDLTVELQPVQNPILAYNVRRQNILAYIGTNRTCRLIMNSHTDVVPPWYPPSDNDTDVFGRGANDAKGSLACQVTAFLELREAGILREGDVCLMYTVGEEAYGDGIRTFVEALTWKPEFIMSGEPTESYQATGHKGSININVTAIGETAHSSVPQYGRNAILDIMDFLPRLLNLTSIFPIDPFHGNTTLSLSSIVGGSISNAVAASAMAVVNCRVGVPAKQIWDIIISQLSDVPYIEVSRLSASSNPLKFDVIEGWLPKKIMPYGTDLGEWTVNNTKFLLGVGSIATAHSDHEVVSKQEMIDMVGHYKDFMQGIINGTLVPIHNGTLPSNFPLEESGNITKREVALRDWEMRRTGGCMH